ncbi:hypothetical protein DFH11DRAFT_1539717 [Phellopilus nigrolimitatus]|nr:hypothetical protein DFH11DRAFT_1539717 [Phellopilus nigrolimitatus]
MLSQKLLFFTSCLLGLLALVCAVPVAAHDNLAKRVAFAEPQGGMGGPSKDWKREPQSGLDKDRKRDPEALPGNMGGSGKDWKREAAPLPQGNMGGSGKDWKREALPQGGMGGSGKDWKRNSN